jgi:hypothetical protein
MWGGATVFALSLIAAVVYFAMTAKRSGASAPATIIIRDHQGKEHNPAVPSESASNTAANNGDAVVKVELGYTGPQSLAEGLEQVGRNRRVVLSVKPAGDWDMNPVVIGSGAFAQCENVHVVGEKPAVVVSTQTPDQPLFLVRRTHGFVLKDLTIDGYRRAAPLIVFEGDGVEGCRLENVVFQNFTGDAVQLLGVRGTKAAPVLIKNCSFKGNGPAARGVVLGASPENPSPSKHVSVEDCRFIGGAAGIAAIGAVASVEAKGNIFASGGVGVLFAPGAGVSLLEELRIENSTFWKESAGVVLEDAPVAAGRVTVADSLFVDVGAPPISGPAPVAKRLRASKGAVESRGLWANVAPTVKDPAKNAAIGPAPVVAPIEFQETDPQKPDFLRPKHALQKQSPAGKKGCVGALPPVAD